MQFFHKITNVCKSLLQLLAWKPVIRADERRTEVDWPLMTPRKHEISTPTCTRTDGPLAVKVRAPPTRTPMHTHGWTNREWPLSMMSRYCFYHLQIIKIDGFIEMPNSKLGEMAVVFSSISSVSRDMPAGSLSPQLLLTVGKMNVKGLTVVLPLHEDHLLWYYVYAKDLPTKAKSTLIYKRLHGH